MRNFGISGTVPYVGYAFLGEGEYAYFLSQGGYEGNIWVLWVGEYTNSKIGYENSRVGGYAEVG